MRASASVAVSTAAGIATLDASPTRKGETRLDETSSDFILLILASYASICGILKATRAAVSTRKPSRETQGLCGASSAVQSGYPAANPQALANAIVLKDSLSAKQGVLLSASLDLEISWQRTRRALKRG
jgi:hypothetical protein